MSQCPSPLNTPLADTLRLLSVIAESLWFLPRSLVVQLPANFAVPDARIFKKRDAMPDVHQPRDTKHAAEAVSSEM